jgi:nucleotide-binding universal stress UspA family protein
MDERLHDHRGRHGRIGFVAARGGQGRQIAAGSDTKVIVATAYFPQSEDHRAADVLKDEGYKMAGNAPIYAILRRPGTGRRRRCANVEEQAVIGAPVDALVDLAEEVSADLLVWATSG